MAARLHRALSRDTIVRPPHAASSASDPRVLALVELDEQLQAEAAGLAEAVDTGRCNCDRDTHDRLIRAGDQAHAALHGRTAASEPAPRPAPMRWLTWAGVVITFAALPIGLMTPIPSVVLSALGLTMVGAAYLAADRRAATRRPADRLRLLLIFGTWLVLVIAAAASLT